MVDNEPFLLAEWHLRIDDQDRFVSVQDVRVYGALLGVGYYFSPIHLEILAQRAHQVVGMCFVGFAVSLDDSYPRCLGLLQQMERFHERELELLDAGVQVFFSAQAACVLEQCHHGAATFILHQRIGIDGGLCGLAVLLALMDDDRPES